MNATYRVTRAMLRAYADASGDQNPIHQDEAVAKAVGLPDVIAHGMFTMALMARAVGEWFPGAEVVEIGGKFTNPVVVPDTAEGVEVSFTGTAAEAEGLTTVTVEATFVPAGGSEQPQKVLGNPKVVVLAERTTLRVGGPADELVVAETEQQLVDSLTEADTAGLPVLLLGGGSNLVIPDSGFAGRVICVANSGVHSIDSDSGVAVVAAAGESWDGLVAWTVAQSLGGLESLSGIPGTVGATPLQNVGAYGHDVAETITSVRVWDRKLRGVRTFAGGECSFGYRTSRFRQDRFDAYGPRHAILSVTFRLAPGDHAALAARRAEVLQTRRSKGMVLDPDDHDSWSVGSFFVNPFVPLEQVPEGAPSYPEPTGSGVARVKVPAAWLIEHAGFAPGHVSAAVGPEVSLSTKHTLAITNRGGATADQVLALAREVRDGVMAAFGIRLEPEPLLLGVSL